MAPGEPMGGGHLRVQVIGGDEIRDALLPRSAGGGVLDTGLSGLVAERWGVRVLVSVDQGRCGPALLEAPSLTETGIDVVALGIGSLAQEPAWRFTELMVEAVARVRAASGAHVLVHNASTFDVDCEVSAYHGIDDPVAVRLQRLNLALLELSAELGVSIIDVDRLTTELGARAHAPRPFTYSPTALKAIRDEVARVLADYGFFEARPVIKQMARNA